MTLEQFQALRTETGRRLLAQLTAEALIAHTELAVIERYRKTYPAELVTAAVELAQLRKRAVAKFAQAAEMYFTRDGLEMASAEPVARHTAARFAGLPRVLDLCCGIGGDTLALTAVAGQVIAVDRDPLALAIARANAGVAARGNIEFIAADAVDFLPGGLPLLGAPDAVFIDPSRRASPAAARRPESYAPPLSWCLGLAGIAPRVGIKVSPALDYDALPFPIAAEVEIISLAGECKEAVLWLSAFATCARRATLLPGGATLTDAGPTSDALGDIGSYLFEPDSAVIRAHLVQRLAGECALRRIDPEIAYLTGEQPVTSPFLTAYRVDAVIPWSLKRLNVALAARGIGHITIKKRGFPLTPDELRPKLKLRGAKHAVAICTTAQGRQVVVIGEKVIGEN